MQDLPLVSIVTPAYNQAEYLVETIESVLAQDYPNIEYIVLDDGSTDMTSEILKRYNGRIRWGHHKNMGQARTVNKGWMMSCGTIVGYLSSDDKILPNAVSVLVKALQTDSNSVVAYCDYELVNTNGIVIRTVEAEDYSHRRLVEELICQPGPGALLRRRIIDEVGLWNVNLHQIPDFEFWLRAARKGHFVHVKQVLAQFRIHEGSTSFRPTPRERSMEIVETMKSYWFLQTGAHVNRSMAMAHLIAAKSHSQSGRYLDFFLQVWYAASSHPKTMISLSAWRMVMSGFLRRAYYKAMLWFQ